MDSETWKGKNSKLSDRMKDVGLLQEGNYII